jgi:hypothetical protein
LADCCLIWPGDINEEWLSVLVSRTSAHNFRFTKKPEKAAVANDGFLAHVLTDRSWPIAAILALWHLPPQRSHRRKPFCPDSACHVGQLGPRSMPDVFEALWITNALRAAKPQGAAFCSMPAWEGPSGMPGLASCLQSAAGCGFAGMP